MLDRMAADWTRKDYRAVADRFGDRLFYSDSLNYSFSTRADLFGFFEDDGGRPQSCRFHGIVYDERRGLGAAEYTYEGTFRYHGTVWVRIEEGKIVEWREYQHKSDLDWKEFWKR